MKKEEQLKELNLKLIEKEKEIIKSKSNQDLLDNIFPEGVNEKTIEKEFPIVKEGFSKVPHGWIALVKSFVSKLNFEKESILESLRLICSFLSVKDRDLFVFYRYSEIKEVKFYSRDFILSSRPNKSFTCGTGIENESVHFFLHPFLYLVLSVYSFSKSNHETKKEIVEHKEKEHFHQTNFSKLYIQELIKNVPFCLYKIESGQYYIENAFREIFPLSKFGSNTLDYKLRYFSENKTKISNVDNKLRQFIDFLEKVVEPQNRTFFYNLLEKRKFFVEKRGIFPAKENVDFDYLLKLYAWTLKYGVSLTAYDSLQKMEEHKEMVSLNRFTAFTNHFRDRLELFLEVETGKEGLIGVFIGHKPALITNIVRNVLISNGKITFDFVKYHLDGKLCKSKSAVPIQQVMVGFSFASMIGNFGQGTEEI